MKRIIATVLLLAVFSALLTGCGEDVEVVTDVKFSVYESNGSDMISFYTTSETEVFGKWEYTLDNSEIFTYFHDSENTEEHGSFFSKKTASYRTLILQPVAEGETLMEFKTAQGGKEYTFKLTVSKDEEGVLRIKGENIEEE